MERSRQFAASIGELRELIACGEWSSIFCTILAHALRTPGSSQKQPVRFRPLVATAIVLLRPIAPRRRSTGRTSTRRFCTHCGEIPTSQRSVVLDDFRTGECCPVSHTSVPVFIALLIGLRAQFAIV